MNNNIESSQTRNLNIKGWRGLRYSAENLLVTSALTAMLILPVTEIVLRQFFHTGISGVNAIVQHLVLIVGMLGGAIAAREGRLLALTAAKTFFNEYWKAIARVISNSVAASICILLCAGSARFVSTVIDSEKILAYGIPIWIVQSILPIGFAIITLRLVWHSSEKWQYRGLSLLLVCMIVGIGVYPPIPPKLLVVPAFIILLLSTMFGIPIFTVLGGAALILFWGQESPIASIAIDHYRMVVNPSLPAIPLFTLAGYFLAEGGASTRLIRVSQALLSHIRGGPAIITALVCAFFTTFTGASGVTILALGGLLLPVLQTAKYSDRSALGLVTASGSLGLLFPPCLPLILYAIVATTMGDNVTIKSMFLGGIGPGTLLVGLTVCWGIRKKGAKSLAITKSLDWLEIRSALWDAKWELLLPVISLTTIFGGFATPVEAAAITALYAFVIETFIYRDLKIIKDIPRVMTECGLLVGGVLLILGVAMGFNNYLIDAQVHERVIEWVKHTIHSPLIFLLTLNVFLLVVGCLMDIYSAIIVIVPLIIKSCHSYRYSRPIFIPPR